MSRWNYILIVVVCAFSVLHTNAQTAALLGNVHADPRLAVLLKKPHNVEAVPAPPVKRKPKPPRQVAETIMPDGTAKPPVSAKATVTTTSMTASPVVAPPANGKPVAVVSTSAGTAISAPATTPVPLDENGHVAGWTPPVRKTRVIYSGKGYRVQIYNGPDRNKAVKIKTEFSRMYPGVRTYLSYISPAFRVKVGDYRNRSDAAGMLRQANSAYNPSMIVPDIITISTF